MSFRRELTINSVTWVVVAESARATVFCTEWPGAAQFETVENLFHPEGESLPSEILTDRPGRFAGPMRHAVGDTIDFRHQTNSEFAIQIADFLERGRTNNEFGRIVLVAPPMVLGAIRERLSAPLAKLVACELGKDYMHLPEKELEAKLHEYLSEQAAATT